MAGLIPSLEAAEKREMPKNLEEVLAQIRYVARQLTNQEIPDVLDITDRLEELDHEYQRLTGERLI